MADKRLATERKLFGARFVDKAVEEHLIRIAERERLPQFRWKRGEYTQWMCTPYGTLEVWKFFSSWYVTRNGIYLVRPGSPWEALFSSATTAKLGGVIHLCDGFSNFTPEADNLSWDMKGQHVAHGLTVEKQACCGQCIKHEHDSTHADEHLISILRQHAAAWAFPPPPWNDGPGFFEHRTPYGTLVARYSNGWTIERDSAPLIWNDGGGRVLFAQLEDAQTAALLNANANLGRSFDILTWECFRQKQVQKIANQ